MVKKKKKKSPYFFDMQLWNPNPIKLGIFILRAGTEDYHGNGAVENVSILIEGNGFILGSSSWCNENRKMGRICLKAHYSMKSLYEGLGPRMTNYGSFLVNFYGVNLKKIYCKIQINKL